jgi:hypothetical protein
VRGDDLKHDAIFSYVWLVNRRMRTRMSGGVEVE